MSEGPAQWPTPLRGPEEIDEPNETPTVFPFEKQQLIREYACRFKFALNDKSDYF